MCAWNSKDKRDWFSTQSIKRSYQKEVLSRINSLSSQLNKSIYGTIEVEENNYDLFIISPQNIDPRKLNILITGGVHGYETSGVHGALSFVESEYSKFSDDFNIFVAPCISPWAYETINRWNHLAIDPNRSFYKDSPCKESSLLMQKIASLNLSFACHIDLHETTDTDNTVFRPALEQRDGVAQEVWDIPDGFYLVGDSDRPSSAFQKAIIDEVRQVTHIAPSDGQSKIIGEPILQEGVINYDVKGLYLCTGFSGSFFSTTTEVYPDSPSSSPAQCILAQVAAIRGALNYILAITKA